MEPPWPASPNATNAARAALERVTATIALASGLAATGRALDLKGLEAEAGTLCAQVLDLPPQDGITFAAPLRALDDRLAALADLLSTPRQKAAPCSSRSRPS